MKKIFFAIAIIFNVCINIAQAQITPSQIKDGSTTTLQILLTDSANANPAKRGRWVYKDFAPEVARIAKQYSVTGGGGGSANAWIYGGNAVSSVQNIGTTSNFALPFITNNSERMRITAAGNVGIGTNSPATALQVNGVITIAGLGDKQLQFSRSGGNVFSFEHDVSRLYFYNSTTGKFPFVINNSSQVGFGTTFPSNKVHIYSESGNPLRLDGLQAGAMTDSVLTSASGVVRRLSINQLGDGNFWKIGGNTEAAEKSIGSLDNYPFTMMTNHSERMRITATGNVVIGNTVNTSSAILELVAADKGFLVPKISNVANVTSPTAGLIVYDNTNQALKIYRNTGYWEALHTPQFGGIVYTNDENYSIAENNEIVYCNNASTDITVTLPSAVTFRNRKITISRFAGSTGVVSITAANGTVMDDTKSPQSSVNLKGLGFYNQSMTFISDGSNWLSIH